MSKPSIKVIGLRSRSQDLNSQMSLNTINNNNNGLLDLAAKAGLETEST